MVRTADAADDFKFIMTCLRHTSGMPKPDFEQVAKELGAKGRNACYHRHWALMKKWGMTGTRKPGTSATPDSGQKRRRADPKKDDAEDGNEGDELGDSEMSPTERKMAKVTAPADLASEVETEEEEKDADELA